MQRRPVTSPELNILYAWQEQTRDAAHSSPLRQQIVREESTLLPRFGAQYTKLLSLPRHARRALQRQWKRSLAGIALLMALGTQPALAATINVGGQCTLVRAIVSANNNSSPQGFCRPGGSADRIVLPRNSTQTLTRVDNADSFYGPAGLPTIRSDITIVGNGSTIRRAPSAPAFRIVNVARGADLTLQQTTVSGARSFSAMFAFRSNITLSNSTISGNSGDGVAVDTRSNLIISNSTISRNAGVGVQFGQGSGGPITNSTIADNRDGGVSVGLYAVANVTGSTISGNSTESDGGGIYALGRLRLSNSTVSNNSATSGGGIYLQTNSNESGVELTDCTITGNSASRSGGGLHVSYTGGSSYFAELSRTMVSGNTAPGGPEVYLDTRGPEGITASNFNIFGHSGNAGVIGFAPGTTDIVPTQPLSGVLNTSLTNNGGRTLTHALVNGSPAIDAVNDGTCPPPATDQRGVSRPRDGNGDGGPACDIGAVEALGSAL